MTNPAKHILLDAHGQVWHIVDGVFVRSGAVVPISRVRGASTSAPKYGPTEPTETGSANVWWVR